VTDFYTYAYLREDGTPYYIGKGRGNRAYFPHRRKIPTPADKSRILILKKNLTESEAFRHEKYIIFVLGKKSDGTGCLRNFTDGGEGPCGLTHTDETRQKMAHAARGKPKTLEHRSNIAAARRGKPRSEETKQKIREKLKGRKLPVETIVKLKEAHKGRKHSEETKEKIRQANTGRKHSEETKEKIRQIRLGGKKS
jgi:hypothetical protein